MYYNKNLDSDKFTHICVCVCDIAILNANNVKVRG
jgi:hypothetical protein